MPVFRERVFSIRAFCPLIIITCLTCYQGICNPFLGGLLPPLDAACCTSFPRCSSLYSSSCLNHLLEHLNKPTYTPLPSLFFFKQREFCFLLQKNKTQSQRQFCPLGPQWRMFFYLCGTLISLGGRSVPRSGTVSLLEWAEQILSPLNTAISN